MKTMKLYELPKLATGNSPASTVTMREITGRDELEAAKAADALTEQKSAEALTDADRREAVRISIVAIDKEPVDHTVPLFAIDQWPRRTRKALERFFADLNGVNMQEIKAATASAVPLSDGDGRFGSRFSLPAGLELQTVEIWELRGIDELEAGRDVDGATTTGIISRELVRRRAMMARAIKESVNWETMGLRTLTALGFLFEHVNGVPEEEISGLVAGAVAVDAAPAEATSPLPSATTQRAASSG